MNEAFTVFVSVAVVKAVLGGGKVSVIVVHAGVALYGVVNVAWQYLVVFVDGVG